MLKATPFEFRFRHLIHTLLYTLGFWAPWERYTGVSFGGSTAWIALTSLLSRTVLFDFSSATRLLLILACVAAVLAAVLRISASAWLGAGVVHSSALHSQRVVADGPFRFVRNPLYLGLFLNVIALALIMPPTGAVFAILTVGLFDRRLIGAEEAFLTRTIGAPYQSYCHAVPRLVPSFRTGVQPSGARPHPITAFFSELFVLGCAITFLAVGYRYNSQLMLKGVLISVGASLIARAFLPSPPSPAVAAPAPAQSAHPDAQTGDAP